VLAAPAHAISIFGSKKPKNEQPARKLTAAQSALVDKAVGREKEVVKALRVRTPLVETYIQNIRPDDVYGQTPESDQHFLGRVDFGRVIGNETYESAKTDQKGGILGGFKHSLSYITDIGKSLHMQFSESGFVQMLVIDSADFDRQNYNFHFVRNDFLGSVPTSVFDVEPSSKKTYGRFFGRIWIERRQGNIVRFNGSFAGSIKDSREFYHFDSWRTNIQDDLWLPTTFYVEESDPRSSTKTVKFKAVNNVWGYALKVPTKEAENVDVEVQGATDVSQDAQDLSPLGAQRAWVQQAEDNVVDRLFQAGLLDAPSEFDKTLELVANNILAYNNIQLSRPIKVRTLLTLPLESLSVGNTIILSKSLIDTTAVPGNNNEQVSNLYAVIAFQLAHVILGHRLDTKYAFNDRLLFPDRSAFARIPMHHTDKDNEEATKKAIELLQAKELSDAPVQFGLYLSQLSLRLKALKALNEPMVGDGLIKDEKTGTFWLQPFVAKGSKLDPKDLKQYAAMPIGAFLRFDPWTDQLIQLHAAYEPLLSARDKMPFEVTPVYIKLGYYKAPPEVVPTPAAPAAAAPGTVAPAPATTAPATTAPPADTTPPPPADTTAPAPATVPPPQ